MKPNSKKILYIDMDGVLVDFMSGVAQCSEKTQKEYEGRLDQIPGVFRLMKPMQWAIEGIHRLSKKYEVYILSTPSWYNSSSWRDKIEWIQKYFWKEEESILYKRLILSHHKNLNTGDYLIDDRTKNGVEKFEGEHIHFGTLDFPNWQKVLEYLMK